ncbi:uncharacterized protein LOC118751885 [Rhagoletis pomonella]|uniref:uncharacterized protein LOC118751885 n=1 Tax=Rhagoletis pomonella TaxID=28610 RepID=UPI00177AB40B|nr:uncharacterized protein LOC118751885 [Rhagoletis pomonella]
MPDEGELKESPEQTTTQAIPFLPAVLPGATNGNEIARVTVESQFVAAGISSDQSKYHTVVAAIESGVLAQIRDLILHPPSSDMYQTLKKRILEQFSDSEQKRIKKLLQDLELGDMRPSHLLREMRLLAGTEMNDSMLRSIWLSRLPQNVRSIISISNEPLDKVALLADKIIEVSDSPQIHAVAARSDDGQSEIFRKMAALTKEVAELKAKLQQRGRQTRRSASRGRSCTPNKGDSI